MDEVAAAYLRRIDAGHRLAFGQFFTPPDVAHFMCRWVLDKAPGRTIFDPAVGLGAFHDAATAVNKSVEFQGMEIDATIRSFLAAHSPVAARNVLLKDYLRTWGLSHARIVCNPPYMRFQKFLGRADVSKAFEEHLGIQLSGYTNIASAFLMKSLSELSEGGRMAYLMPLEFLNTGYGTAVKERLLESGHLKALIQLSGEKEVFPDAITSVGILLVHKDGVSSPVRFFSAHTSDELHDLLNGVPAQAIAASELRANEKWLRHFDPAPPALTSDDLVGVGFYGRFSRGIATGANEFFALSESRAKILGLPRQNLVPCITRSAQIRTRFFGGRDFERLAAKDASVFLLNLNGQLDKSSRAYIQHGESSGFHTRYLTRMRTPWYKLERRLPAPILFGVFSRSKFKAIRNTSAALNLTCFHGFHPNLFGEQIVDALFLYFQSAAARTILGMNKRRYGDGLDKFEPNDLNHALAPSPEWFDALPDSLIERALEYCREYDRLPAEMEEAFSRLIGESGDYLQSEALILS